MKVDHIGTLVTKVDYRLNDGSMIRLSISFKNECFNSHQATYYSVQVSIRGFKCRNWVYQFTSENELDRRILNKISEQQLYDAYYVHWQKLNPIRKFRNGQNNSELVGFRVNEKFQTKHFAF